MWYRTMKSCLKWRPVVELSELASSWDHLWDLQIMFTSDTVSQVLQPLLTLPAMLVCCCYIQFWQAAQGPLSWISHLSCSSDKPSHNLSYKTWVTIAATFWVCMCLCVEENKREEVKILEKNRSLGGQKITSGIRKGKMKIRSINFLRLRGQMSSYGFTGQGTGTSHF